MSRGDRVWNEEKVERSIPASSRIDIVDLMRLDKFWDSKGVRMRTLSRLINWSISAFVEVLEDNQMIEVERENNAMEALRYLEDHGLVQASNMKRGSKKLMNGISMKNLRYEGDNPEELIPRAFNMLHKRGSVEAYDGSAGNIMLNEGEETGTKIDWDEIERQKEEGIRKEIEEAKENMIKQCRESGSLAEENKGE